MAMLKTFLVRKADEHRILQKCEQNSYKICIIFYFGCCQSSQSALNKRHENVKDNAWSFFLNFQVRKADEHRILQECEQNSVLFWIS
jgi:hypothetical protein